MLRMERAFLDERKSIFNSFWRAIICWKNKSSDNFIFKTAHASCLVLFNNICLLKKLDFNQNYLTLIFFCILILTIVLWQFSWLFFHFFIFSFSLSHLSYGKISAMIKFLLDTIFSNIKLAVMKCIWAIISTLAT